LEPDPDHAGAGKSIYEPIIPSLHHCKSVKRNTPMLSVSGLTKNFDTHTILDNFQLTVPVNGFTVMIGPSGCGKSTLLDLLTGVITGESGEITWHGKTMPNLGDNAAYMQQKDLLLPWFSLLENSLLPAMVFGQDIEPARKRAVLLFRRMGLHGFEKYLPNAVSGGMRQRCALVRTLMFNRELVLLDEPLSALDAITRSKLQSLLLLLQSEFNKSILMITHDIEEALLLADELLVLTPAPMRIQEKFSITSPKPRRASDPRIIEIKEHVLEQLQGDPKNEPF